MTSDLREALQRISHGSQVVAAMAAAEPQLLFESLGAHCSALKDVVVHCANPSQNYDCFRGEGLAGRLTFKVMFLTDKVRALQGRGRIHYIPQHLSQWVRNLESGPPVDMFWGSCSPPDARGFVSLGPGACYEPEILRMARTVVLEVNPNIPITAGATTIPVPWVHHFVSSNRPLPTAPRQPMTSVDRTIATHIAELVPDGATIQLGIGSIPNAIGEALATKKDLGVHTEMINDTIMDLCISGAITGRKKTLWPGKIVGSFVFGSRELYDFVHANPIMELQPASLVNDPYRIGRNHRMVSINTAVEIDLTGQVCSESIGHVELSGAGGAADTHVGAQRSANGRGIVALHAKTRTGESKIVFELKPGAKVSISRNDTDTVVTEYGVARLKGKSVADRVVAMIRLAAPEYREELQRRARDANYL